MKRFKIEAVLGIVATLLLFASCNKITYEGEYNTDGYYRGNNGVYFYFKEQSDTTISYSFGPRPETTTQDTINIPVRALGVFRDRPQAFKVEVDPTSTAEVGKHFQALKSEYTIPANSYEGTIPVIFYRADLPSGDDDKALTLVLRLASTDDLKVEFAQENKVTIQVDNILKAPYLWTAYAEAYPWGPYSKTKHLKLIEISGGYDKFEESLENPAVLYLNIIKMRRYFLSLPNNGGEDFPPFDSPYDEE